jgi:hypothetical protein
MSDYQSSPMDLIRELRLRQWARQHFVVAAERRPTWHPVVLDEMRQRDQEMSIDEANQPNPGSTFVPLAPHSRRHIHPAASAIPQPHCFNFSGNRFETAAFTESAESP